MRPRYGIGLVVLALIGVFGYDGARTALAKSGASDDATQIAHDAATYYHTHSDVNGTFANAQAEAAQKGDTVLGGDSFSVDGAGTVSLAVQRSNSTLILGRIDSSWRSFTSQASSTWSP